MAKLPVRVPTRTQKADPYYDLEGKHFTPNNWDEIDMSKVDLGFHIDPSPKGLQAADREQFYRYMKNNDGGDTKDLRFRVGNTLIADDVGRWDMPATAREGILNALYSEDLDLASNFEFEFPRDSMSSGLTTRGDKDAIADMDQMRGWLLGNDIDTIQYKNTSEGADEAAELALLDPEWLRYEQEMLEKIEDAKERNWEAGLGDGPAADALLELEDELEYARDEVLEEAAEGNVSYIALDPGNVRSANAKFDPKNYGKPGMMLGAGGLGIGMAAGSGQAEAGTLENARKLAANSGATQVATTGGTYEKAGRLLDDMGAGPNRLDYGSGLGHGTASLGPEARSLEVNPKPGYEPDFTESPDEMFDGIANLNVLNVVPEPIRSQIAQDILGKLNVGGVAAVGARSYPDVMGAKNPEILDDGGIVTSRGTYQYGFGGENEGLVPYLERQAESFPDKEFEITKKPLAATGAAVRRIKSLLPLGTLGALSSLTSEDASAADIPAGVLDVANRTGEMLLNDALTGSQMLSNAMYDTKDVAPQVQFAPRTEAGDALSEGILSDLGDVINYRGLGGNMPSLGDAIQGGVDLYNEYVSPYLSERQEMGLAGSLLAASTLFPGGKANKIPDASAGVLDDVDPRMQMVGQSDRRPQTRDDRGMKRVTDPKGVNSLEFTEEVGDLVEVPQARASDLVNRPYVANMADTSSANRLITSVDGRDVNVRTHGGIDFPRDPMNWGDMRAWSSDSGAITSLLNALSESAQLPGARGNPLLIPEGMKYGESSDFAHFSADLGVQHAQQNMDPAAIRALDKRIREGSGGTSSDLKPVEGWPGIMNATPEYLTSIGGRRKNVVKALDEFRNEGALNASQIRHLVSDPAQQDVWRPAQQLMVIEPNMNRAPEPSTNLTYDTDIFRTGGERSVMSMNPGWSVLDDPSARFRKDNETSQKLGKFLVSDRPQYQQYRDKGTLNYGLNKAILPGVIGVLDEKVIEEMVRRGVLLDE